MSKNRQLAREYALLYKRADVDLDCCSYCGGPRECLDHVPPLCVTDVLDREKAVKDGIKFLLFPCCLQCNSWLGSRKLGTYAERLSYLYGKVSAYIDKQSNLWEESEIQELGRNLQQAVRLKQKQLQNHITKLRGIEKNLNALDVLDEEE